MPKPRIHSPIKASHSPTGSAAVISSFPSSRKDHVFLDHFAMWTPDQVKQICVVGGGNASQVVAALLSESRDKGSGISVAMLAPFQDESKRLLEGASANDGITLQNPDGTFTKGMPDIITDDPAKALRNSQVVILPLPTFAIPAMLELMAPHLERGTWVGAMPAQGGVQWVASRYLDMSPDGKAIKFFGLDKLPYNCRTIDYGSLIRVFGYKTKLGIACLPTDPDLVSTMAKTLSAVIPKIELSTLPNFLVVTLSAGNQVMHPSRMYGLYSQQSTWDRIPLFYDEMDDRSAELMEKVSDDAQAICRALEDAAEKMGISLDLSDVLTVGKAALKVYEVTDTSSLRSIFATCKGLSGIKTPMKKVTGENGIEMYELDWSCRYFHEDIPALCVLRGLAQLASVKVPNLDMLIRWAQEHAFEGYELLKGDMLNEDRERVMYTPQYWGISSLEELLRFHA